MLYFCPVVVRAEDRTGWISALDPIHDAQHGTMVRLVDPVGVPTFDSALTELPCAGPPDTVSHTGYHEQPIERVHLVINAPSSSDCPKIS